jgi:hypothetical protein
MAYFPNGSAGEVLDEQCAECLPDEPCPVFLVQMEYNYTQCEDGQEKMRSLLNFLVDKKGTCQMKKYINPRLTEKHNCRQSNHPSLKRKLVFGDIEQIEALR